MTYSEAVDYILDIPKFTKKNDAAHTKAFLKTLGDPQRKMRIIHVAGTNGKGSVCAYLDGMLRSEQKRTGLFTSPHLVKINERIVIDGQMISDERFLEVFEETMQAVDKMKENRHFSPVSLSVNLPLTQSPSRDSRFNHFNRQR